MSLGELSIDEIIERVERNRDRVLHHSTLLSQWLQRLDEGRGEEYENIRQIKIEIRTTVKELNNLGGYCDNKAKALIAAYSESGAQFNKLNSVDEFRTARREIDYWTTQIQAIGFNYERFPFKINAGLELQRELLRARICSHIYIGNACTE